MQHITEDQLQTQALDHLGLVAGTMKKVKLKERVDKFLPVSKENGAHITMGERVEGMILNALGFIESPLYMYTGFMRDKPIKKLLGEHIEAEHFTDDALGRCLDAIHEYGPTKLFSDVVFGIAAQLDLLGKSVHIDTTTLTLYGQYENQKESKKTPQPTYGYSKANRPDLKQLVLTLATTNKADLPIFMAAHSGNESDQEVLIKAAQQIDEIRERMASTSSFIYVADSAMYESCLKKGQHLLWLSRVPMQRKEAKKFVQNSSQCEWKVVEGTGYKVYSEEKNIGGIKQRWVLVFSEQAYSRELKALEKNILKAQQLEAKKLWHLCNQVYGCQKDALKALKTLEKKFKYHKVDNVEVVPVKKHDGKGRPAKGSKKITVGFQITAILVPDQDKIDKLKRQKGLFILATNQFDKKALSDQDVLFEYKGQQKTERGFAFIKDKAFEVSSVFLKKPSRISALMMIMALTLFVYSLTQYLLRVALKEKDAFVPNQVKKMIQNPTAKWIFFLFRNVQLVKIRGSGFSQELVANVTPLLKRITTYFGEGTMAIYDVTLPEGK